MPDSRFYLGRWSDDQRSSDQKSDDPQPVQYDPTDLTTHAVMIGMTGSGKTGLLIALLEEAARQGLPAIILDPKGDLTNLLLHFPELLPADFAPWIDPEAARRAGVTLDQMAEATAARWRKGLADWNLGSAELTVLRDALDYTIFTPGSTAGVPVNLLSSFAAPVDWQGNLEAHRERIASTVTALLGLVGMTDVDPLRSREHILLSNILESAWSQGQSLDLAGLIEQVTTPPFTKLGVFPLERFFPEKDRFELALLLNNFLSAPSFQTWLEGQPLEVDKLLYTRSGGSGAPVGNSAADSAKPRFSIFYLAHLSENERMFFVTLLLAAVEGWMRSQRGSSGLRALLAFDEIYGYLPPVANPPSRPVLLRLLKQARAFGLGLVLATQNPSDLNYKALSNAGTWFIGRLQTEQDKQRLLDGLQSLDSGINRADFDQMIGRLGPRLFLLHNVHQPGPRIFQSRWDMNYLAGPLTRAQLPALKPVEPSVAEQPPTAQPMAAQIPPAPAGSAANPAVYNATSPSDTNVVITPRAVSPRNAASVNPAAPAAAAGVAPAAAIRATAPSIAAERDLASLLDAPPALPAALSAFYLPAMLSVERALAAKGGALRGPIEQMGLVYRPALLAEAEVRYINRRYNLDHTQGLTCLAADLDLGRPDWDACSRPPLDPGALLPTPVAWARFRPLPAVWQRMRSFSSVQKDFLDWAYRTAGMTVHANEALKLYAAPEVGIADFSRQVQAEAGELMQAEIDKTAAAYDQKLDTLARKIERQQLTVNRRQDNFDQRKNEQFANGIDFVGGLIGGRKRSLSSLSSKNRMTQQAKGELDDAKKVLKDLEAEWKALAEERKAALEAIQSAWQERAAQISEIPITPLKKDVLLSRFGIAWQPVYLLKTPDGLIELPAY